MSAMLEARVTSTTDRDGYDGWKVACKNDVGGNEVNVVILAGGRGTRFAEETEVTPKPMIQIGGHPMLWHIMTIYAQAGFKEFIVALGYKGEVITDYFVNFQRRNGDMTVDLATGSVDVNRGHEYDWKVRMVRTGHDTMTGGRLRRLEPYLKHMGTFMLTYGDGVCDVDIEQLLRFHRNHGRMATLTAVRPPARFGALEFEGDLVTEFTEKPQTGEGWINGGFFVFEPGVFDYLHGDEAILEADALERLAADGELMAYRHHGFWQCMDTLRDKISLDELWQTGNAPWMSRKAVGVGAADAPAQFEHDKRNGNRGA
jgi:glucose-1-phosphate cytidylyltransferase